MWVMTQDGFYSVVQYVPRMDEPKRRKNAEDSLLVRARVREDLEALGKYVPRLTIRRDDSADYMFRTIMTREEWTTCLASVVQEIDYTNFKNRVGARQGAERSSVYHRVWRALLSLQPSQQAR